MMIDSGEDWKEKMTKFESVLEAVTEGVYRLRGISVYMSRIVEKLAAMITVQGKTLDEKRDATVYTKSIADSLRSIDAKLSNITGVTTDQSHISMTARDGGWKGGKTQGANPRYKIFDKFRKGQ